MKTRLKLRIVADTRHDRLWKTIKAYTRLPARHRQDGGVH